MSSSFLRKNAAIAWPLALNGLLMQSMLMIDTLLVSPLGEVPLAAMGLSTAVLAFMLGVHMALANGSQLVLSRAVGSGLDKNIAVNFCSGLVINAFVACVFLLVLALFKESLIMRLSGTSDLAAQTHRYLNIAFVLIPLTALTQMMIALLNSQGKSRLALFGYLLELPVNVVLSYCFINGDIFGLELGVAGAALGSAVAMLFRLFYLTFFVLRGKVNVLMAMSISGFTKNLKKHANEVFPVAANITILQIGMSVYQLLYSQLSVHSYAAIIIIMPWLRGGSQFVVAWAHAAAINLSQIIGARNLQALPTSVNKSIQIAVCVSCVCAFLFAVLSVFLPSFYPDLEQETYLALTLIAPLYIFLPIVRGYNTIHGNVLRSLGRTTAVFKINFTGQWLVSIPLCAALILYFDVSIFWAFAVQPFEEVVKMLPFRWLARKTLRDFNDDKLTKLMF
ncbi:MATE family efflux transporter [Marinomonas epiphytica]